jgi:protein MBA1
MAFAAGETSQIKAIANDSLTLSMSARLSHRPETERLNWVLINYLKKPRLVSHRATALPMKIKSEDVGIRQAVVKIVSLQQLQRGQLRSSRLHSRGTKGGNEFWRFEREDVEWEPEREKIVAEYVVLQTMLIEGKEQPWKIWGFGEETKVEDLKGVTPGALAGMESSTGEKTGGAQATAASM